MTYPNQSNGWSGATGSMWWKFRDQSTAVVSVCVSQIKSVVQQLQRNLRSDLPFAFTVDSVPFLRSSIDEDGNFGPVTFAGLRRMLDDKDAPQTIRDTVLADYERLAASGHTATGARGQPVTLATMAVICWLAAHRNLPWSSMLVPADMTPLRFATVPPDDGAGNGLITCVDERRIGQTPGAPPSELGTGPSTSVGEQAAGDDSAGLAIAAAAALAALFLTGKGSRSPF